MSARTAISLPETAAVTAPSLPAPLDPAVLPLLLCVAIALAILLSILAIAVTTGVGRLGRVGVDRSAADEPRHQFPRSLTGSRPVQEGLRAHAHGHGHGPGIAADHRPDQDPWREAGRRLTPVGSP